MRHPDYEYSLNKRRIIGITGIIIALLLILGVVVYSSRAGILPIPGRSPAPGISIFIQQQTSACKTPPHQPGDKMLSIHSAGLSRSFLVHLPPSYGTKFQAVVIN